MTVVESPSLRHNLYFVVFFLTQKLLPLMNDGGRIVNISSGVTPCIGARQLSIRSGKGCHRGADALSRKGAWPATNLGERLGSYEGRESRNT